MKLTDRFSEMGIASLLAGMRYAHDRLGEEIKVLEQTLEAHHQMREQGLRQVAADLRQEFGFEPKRRGRPPGTKHAGWAKMTAAERSAEMIRRQEVAVERRRAGLPPSNKRIGKSWASMTAEERSKEMLRRQAVARGELPARDPRTVGAAPTHPRDARHPEHEAWLEKMRKVTKKRWKGMTASERKERVAKMVAGQRIAREEIRVNGAAQ